MAAPRVSDLQRFTQLTRRPFRLLAIGVAALLLTVLYGRWVGPKIDHELRSVGLAFALVCIQFLLACTTGYLLSLALSVFAFGKAWRDQYLLPHIPPNPRDPEAYLARIGDKTLPFGFLVVSVCIAVVGVVHVTTGNYLLQFPSRGYQLVSFRSESPIAQQRAMREMVGKDLARHLDADDLRERMRVYLESPPEDVQAQAAWTVGRLQLVSLEPSIRKLLQHAEPEVRIQAAIAEGQLRTTHGSQALIDALKREENAEVQQALAIAIGLSRNLDAAYILVQHLDHLDDTAMPAALWAIGESNALCAAEDVMRFTDASVDHEIRCAAMDSIKKISTIDQLDALWETYRGEDVWCELRVWRGRSSDPVKKDFYRMLVSAERVHEKAMDAIFNVAGPGLKEDLAEIVNDTDQERLDRKHARRLYDLLDPAHPRTAREAVDCPQTVPNQEAP